MPNAHIRRLFLELARCYPLERHVRRLCELYEELIDGLIGRMEEHQALHHRLEAVLVHVLGEVTANYKEESQKSRVS